MTAFSMIRTAASRVSEARRRRHTRRIVEALPMDIQKDIGWRD